MKRGSIVTFYSYKGGVGRSFALANVAVTLAKWRFKVLCVDWDLEAPGLAFYFEPWSPEPKKGLVHYIAEFSEGSCPSWEEVQYSVKVPGTESRLSLVPAGSKDNRYVDLLRAIDWRGLFTQHQFGAQVELLRDQWADRYDFVLLDSRTGVSDIGGVCTVHFPDVLVFFFTANRQSLEGAIGAARGTIAAHDLLEGPRLGLLTLPVVSKFEPSKEYDSSLKWMEVFVEKLSEFYEAWAPDEGPTAESIIRTLIERTTLPYFAKWSFGEELPVLLEANTGSTQLIGFYLETIAAILALRFENSSLLVQSAEQYIQAAKRHGSRTSHAAYDIFLSVDRRDWDYGAPLVEALRRQGASVFTAAEASDPTAPSAEQRKEALDISQSFVFVAGAGPDLEAENDLNQFLRDSLNDQASRPALPVLLKTSTRSALPQSLRGHRVLSGREDPLILAARIVGALSLNRGLKLERQFTGHTDVILRLAWHPQGKQLSTSSVDNSAKIWDVPTGELIVTLKCHSFGVNRAIWSPDAKLLATCSFDRTLRIWSTEDWNCLRIIDKPHNDDIPSVAWSPDSRLLASGTADGMIFVWDSSNWELLLRINTQSQSINCILWFKDSSRIYAACADGSIGVWAINNGKCEVQLKRAQRRCGGYRCITPEIPLGILFVRSFDQDLDDGPFTRD